VRISASIAASLALVVMVFFLYGDYLNPSGSVFR
jgi:hypothetical protein